MTQTAPHDALLRIRWPLRLTLAGLWAERITRAFWPLWTVMMAALAALAFGLQDALPLEGAWAGLVATALALLVALVWGVRRFRKPTRIDALARLDASLPGRPITALADNQVIGGADAASVAVWQAHRARMAQRVSAAKAVAPDLRVSQRDPFGLRYLALTALVLAVMFGSIWRVGSVAGLGAGDAQAMPNGPTWEGWAQPPMHTGKPALYLNDIAAGPLSLPQGSKLQLRLYGDVGALTVAETVSARTTPPVASDPVQEFDVAQSGALAINGPGGREWAITALPDAAPTVTTDGKITREKDGNMKLPFSAKDDYAITKGTATVALDLPAVPRTYGLTADPEPRAALVMDLPLPISGNRAEFTEDLIEDVSKHPFANLPVQITLSVQDAMGQTGTAAPIAVTLPGKRFFDPLAAALIEMRRDLLWTRSNAARSAQILKAVTHLPEGLIRDQSAYLRLRVALRRLDVAKADLSAELRDELADELWEIALLVEEGDLASARERLDRAQDRLDEAIRNGADPAEIQELMDELREAMDDYMRQLAEESQRNPDTEMSENQERREITGDQIQQMMDEIQRLMEEGKMAEAAQAMEMLRQLLENLQVTEGPGGQGGPGSQAMRDLGETLRDQQGLSDEAFRELQQGPQGPQPGKGEGEGEGQGEGSLAERQRALRERLEGLRGQGLPGAGSEKGEAGRQALDDAGRAMDEAERALRDGDLSGALDEQADAMERMREGLRSLGEAQAQEQLDTEGEAFGRADPNSSRDPLGREQGEAGRIGSDRNMLQGQDVYRRAQDLLDEIRRRSGEQSRPSGERDYLRRLLDLF